MNIIGRCIIVPMITKIGSGSRPMLRSCVSSKTGHGIISVGQMMNFHYNASVRKANMSEILPNVQIRDLDL